MDELLFPCATFLRVFDTEPAREVLTLPQLLAALRRFEVRSDTVAAVDRELARIHRARDLVLATGSADGSIGLELGKVYAAAKGGDPRAAVEAAVANLDTHARKDAKRDLRLWSPALYPAGAKRGSEAVIALSALVLDYDAGVSIEDAVATWEGWLHLVHTTWSHAEDRPRFRMVLPLARLVAAAEWPAVWNWANERAEGRIDPALKGAGATYALPACPSADAPRFVEVYPGELFDPLMEGLTLLDPDPPEPIRDPPPSRMFRMDVKREVLDG